MTVSERRVVLQKSGLHSSLSDPLLDTMTFLNDITRRYPEAISFAPGRPYDGFFAVEQIFSSMRRYLDYLRAEGLSPAEIRDAMFQYGPSAGRIRGLIAESLRADEGIDVSPEAIVVTVGAQEAMLLVLRALFASPDDVLLVSSPCYVGITGAARLLDIPVAPVPEGIAGLARGGLDSAVRAARSRGVRPRAVYVTPDHSNPSGSTIPEPDRHELVKLAGRLGVLIIEDSPYRLVSPGERLPTLKRLDRRGAVIHLGSFAKSMFPGARMGFVVADQEVTSSDGQTALLADELAKIKSMVTVNTSPLSQAVIAGMLIEAGGGAAARNKETSEYYGAAMTATLRELDLIFPAHRRARLRLRWSQPSGGFFIAMSVPFRADNAALGRSAQHHGVIWTPMSYFHPDGGGAFQLRLSISYLTEAEITEGVTRLAAFIEDEAHRQEVSDQETRNHEEGQR